MKKAFSVVLFLGLIMVVAISAEAKNFRLSIGAGHPADAAIWITTMRDFFEVEVKKRVEANTEHKIEWVQGYGGSVAKLGECLEAVESGLLDIADLHVPFEPSKLMAYNFPYFVPFGQPDPEKAAAAARKVYDDFPQLRENLEKKFNQVYIATGSVGNYNLVTTFPWEKVEELNNQKVAAAGPNLPWLSPVGAVPVQSNLNEAYTSFQTGVYNGWIMFPDATVSFKLHEVAKYYTFTDFGAIPNVLITMNKDTWKSLPEEVQNIILEVGKEYTAVESKAANEKGGRSVKTMEEAGVTVRSLNWDEKVKWAKALPNIPKERAEEISKTGMPGEVIYAYIKNLKEIGFEFPRDWASEK